MSIGDSDSARREILQRIRRAGGRAGERPSAAEEESVEAYLRAHPRGPLRPQTADLVERFRTMAESMQSSTEEIRLESEAPAAVANYLQRNRLPTYGCVWPALAHLDWQGAGLELAPRAAKGEDAVGVTGAFAALAETGTTMLVSGADTPASASLLPETHIALVPVSCVVASMEEAWDRARHAFGALPRSVNFISGPSRTGDIEQKMVLGAHGPYRVHLILVRGA